MCSYGAAAGCPSVEGSDVFVVPHKPLRKTPVKKHGYVADEKRITSLPSKQLNIKENTLTRCLTGETSQNFTFIQHAGFNAKPQFISQGRKKKAVKETLSRMNTLSAVAWRQEGGLSKGRDQDIQVSGQHCP